MDIHIDDLSGPEIAAFLEQHLKDLEPTAPAESRHALDLSGLRLPQVTFWTVWDNGTIAACGAIKALDAQQDKPQHAELKSMRTAPALRGKGVASALLRHILQHAQAQGFERISLETGSMEFFAPARRLYAAHGFVECGPFGDYRIDPNSVFMTRAV